MILLVLTEQPGDAEVSGGECGSGRFNSAVITGLAESTLIRQFEDAFPRIEQLDPYGDAILASDELTGLVDELWRATELLRAYELWEDWWVDSQSWDEELSRLQCLAKRCDEEGLEIHLIGD